MLLKKTFNSSPERAQNLACTDTHKRFLVCSFSLELLTNLSIAALLRLYLLSLYKGDGLPQTVRDLSTWAREDRVFDRKLCSCQGAAEGHCLWR